MGRTGPLVTLPSMNAFFQRPVPMARPALAGAVADTAAPARATPGRLDERPSVNALHDDR